MGLRSSFWGWCGGGIFEGKTKDMTQQDATVVVHVNNQEAEEKVRNLQSQAKKLRQEFAEAVRIGDKGTIAKTEKELRKVNKELNNATLRTARIRDAMKHLSQATPKELHNTLKLINQELNSGAVKRGSKEWKQYQEQIKKVNAELRQIKSETQQTESRFSKLGEFGYKWGNTITGAINIGKRLVDFGQKAIQAYTDIDTAMANTQKFTGMTRQEVESLNEQLKSIDTRTSIEGLNELAQAAGRLGKNSVEDVMGFVRAGDIIGVAMDELGAEAPQVISQLARIFNLESELGTEKAMLSVGSAINTLSQNCAASAPNLVDFAGRLGAIANSTNMSMDEMLAFGALLDDQKVSIEKSSTAIQGVITKMYADPAEFARKAGMNAEAFTEALKRSSAEGIMMFVESLAQMDQMQQASTLKELGTAGAGVTQTFQTLAGKVDLLKTQMETSKKAFEDATSATEEFNVQNNTAQARLDKARKGVNTLTAELGKHLVPVMEVAISGTSLMLKILKTVIEFMAEYKGIVITLTSAIVAYNIAVKASAIALAAKNGVIKASIALKYAWTAATKLATATIALFSGNIKKATVAWRAFSMAIKLNPIGLLVGAITAVVTGLTMWITRTKQLNIAQQQLNDIEKTAHQNSIEELTDLKLLYEASQNQNRSLAERTNAVKQLQDKYPDYFRSLTTEAILAGKAKKKYDELTQSIISSARAEARKAQLVKNETKIAELENQRDEKINNALDSYSADYSDTQGRLAHTRDAKLQRLDNFTTEGYPFATHYKNLIDNIREEYNSEIEKYKKINKQLAEDVASGTIASQPNENNCPKCGQNPCVCYNDAGNKNGDRKSNETEQRAKDLLKQQRENQEEALKLENDMNQLAYTLGEKSYLDYVQRKHQIDLEAISQQKKTLENANLTETQEYADLLKKEADLIADHEKGITQLKEDELENRHKAEADKITSKYFDPKDNTYSSEKSYRQALLELDINYLQKKQQLYEAGSKEYEEIEQQINERVAEDKLQKQKETSEAIAYYQKEYSQKSSAERMQMELNVLDELHKKGLLSEEEYNRAVAGVKRRYMNEDIANARKTQSEYADLVVNLYTSFSKFFEDLGKKGTNFWDNLASASQAAYALMSAALSQYSAYSNAERDLEIAKIENRYEREIEAAGNNTKKREQLEQKKEEEIAQVKTKYNKRAMKIELAQAVAQTAMAAIAAYASALSIPGIGWLLAPIAASLAVAAGMLQIATIKKQHQAEAMGYYEGGFTDKSSDNHKEVGVVHANEFVANHKAVSNPRLRPMFNLIDAAQRNNTVGSLTAEDVSDSLGQGRGAFVRTTANSQSNEQVSTGLALVAGMMDSAGSAIDRLNKRIDDGIETVMIMDGERGFARKYEHYQKLTNKTKR